MPFVAFYVLCHHGKAQNDELLSTACVLQVILYNWDWKTKPPGTIQQSRAKRPRSPHRFSAKLSTHSSIQSNETRWSPPSHRKRILQGQPLAAFRGTPNYSHHRGHPICQLILPLSQKTAWVFRTQCLSQLSEHLRQRQQSLFYLRTIAWELRQSWGHCFSLGLTSCDEEKKRNKTQFTIAAFPIIVAKI